MSLLLTISGLILTDFTVLFPKMVIDTTPPPEDPVNSSLFNSSWILDI